MRPGGAHLFYFCTLEYAGGGAACRLRHWSPLVVVWKWRRPTAYRRRRPRFFQSCDVTSLDGRVLWGRGDGKQAGQADLKPVALTEARARTRAHTQPVVTNGC